MSLSSLPKTKSGKQITLGFGTGTKLAVAKRDGGKPGLSAEVVEPLVLALKSGFNHLDTAEAYSTEAEVGEAVKQVGVKREDIWITSKHSPHWLGHERKTLSPTEYVEYALRTIDTPYLDALLIHWPYFGQEDASPLGLTIEQVWTELEAQVDAGKVRYLGVLNFTVSDLEKILAVAKHAPLLHQIEFHASLPDQTPGVVEFSQKHGIVVEAYGPLTALFRDTLGQVKHVAEEIAEAHSQTAGQVLLQWVVEQDVLPVTTSSNEQRIKDALEVKLDRRGVLTAAEVAEISAVGKAHPHRAFFKDQFGEPAGSA